MGKSSLDPLAWANASGKDVMVSDDNGNWRIHQVVRVSHSPHGPFQYVSNLRFRKTGDDLTRTFYGKIKYSDPNRDSLRTALRKTAGCDPSGEVVTTFLAYIHRMLEAWEDADDYYRNQDKDWASSKLQALIDTAVERVARGEEVAESRTDAKWGRPAFELYVTRQEQEEAKEAQKVLNGSAHEVPDGVPLREHLADFKKRLAVACQEKSRQIKDERLSKRRRRLLDLLETDVELRRLVALALEADREPRGGGLAYELPYRLFGYSHDENSYKEALKQLVELLELYSLDVLEMKELVQAGDDYLSGGGMLPVAAASFFRREGQYAFGDRIIVNGRQEKVARVGTTYLYGPKGQQWEKATVKHRAE